MGSEMCIRDSISRARKNDIALFFMTFSSLPLIIGSPWMNRPPVPLIFNPGSDDGAKCWNVPIDAESIFLLHRMQSLPGKGQPDKPRRHSRISTKMLPQEYAPVPSSDGTAPMD